MPQNEFLGTVLECKILKKSVPHPYGVRSEAIWRVYFGCTVAPVLKYTLKMASGLTPNGWGTLFFNTLHSNMVPRNSPFESLLAQNYQKSPKKHLFDHFSEGPGQPDHVVAESRKRGEFPPAGPSDGGRNPHFFPGFSLYMVRCPGPPEGGLYKPL